MSKSATDELSVIDGHKPTVVLVDGEEKEVGSQSSNRTYKVKRTFDHYYCNCPAWRNQARVPVNARTCKHLRSLLGDKYEDARIKLKNPDAEESSKKPSSKKVVAPKSTGTRSSKRKQAEIEEEDENVDEKPAKRARKPTSKKSKDEVEDEPEEDNEEDEKPKTRARKPASKAKPASKSKPPSKSKPASKAKPASATKSASRKQPKIEEEDAEMGDEEEEDDNKGKNQVNDNKDVKMDEANQDGDELANINGVKPKVSMVDGDEKEVKSQTSSSTYKVKRTWDHYYCTCPAWRNQSGNPVNARTCKHLRALLGDAYEDARLKFKNPDGAPATSSKKPASKKATRKTKGADDDDEDDEVQVKKAPELLLANKWDLVDGPDPTGWLISEKLDGVRAYYDGKRMISRLGNPFTPPQWFLDKLPKDMTLDGELFGGRGEFQSTVSIAKTVNSPHWKNITYQVFDIPSRGQESFEDRIEFLKETFGPDGSHASEQVVVVEHTVATSRQHVLDELKRIEGLGGEGLMLRKPQSQYEGKRSSTLLKIKTFYDAEAVVTGYVPGKGRHKGSTGALKCKMASGKTFNVGTGLSDKQRKNPPKVGAIITYRFQELTRDKVPRFPSYIGEALDKDEPKDAEIPDHRKTGATGTDAPDAEDAEEE